MNYQLQLTDGRTIDLTNAEFDAQAFTTTLNDQTVLFVNIGGAILNKHLISTIVPVA